MNLALANLMACAGIMDSVIDAYPAGVSDGWDEKIESITEWAKQTTEEITIFGEAYDCSEKA